MKVNFILLSFIAVSVAGTALTNKQVCACNEITQEADCKSAECTWSDNSCEELQIDCSTQTKENCNDIDSCFWKDTECVEFTSCFDLTTYEDGKYCKINKPYCMAGTPNGPCLPTVCKDITQESPCIAADESSSTTCDYQLEWGSKGQCIAVDISKCSVLKNDYACQKKDCYWDGTVCVPYTCAQYSDDSAKCLYVYSDDFSTITVCTYVDNKCQEAVDGSALTKDNCQKNTNNYFTWDGTTCKACVGADESNSAYILELIVILIIMFI